LYSESAQTDSVSENDPVSKKLWEIHHRLTAEYGSVISFLNYGAPFELLIGVILSAQTTDIQVNAVTPKLFARFPDAAALAAAPRSEVEEIIKSTGFYRSKAAHIQGAAVALVREYHGEVPRSMSELTSLPGVGRKSANVVRSHVFGLPAIIVDTHFGRVMQIGRASCRERV
jgi:endonuclease III